MSNNENIKYNYTIELTPVDKFFFGGDMTFQVGDKENNVFNTQFSSYIIQSNRFPQQTSLLGMLRFLILRNAGDSVFKNNKIQDSAKAGELIGSKSFAVNVGNRNEFGKIKNISHVRVRRDGEDLEFAPFSENDKLKMSELLGGKNSVDGTYNLGYLKVPSLTDVQYDAKKGLPNCLYCGTRTYTMDDVFVEDRRVGIARNTKTGKTEDNALFKQISYRFKDFDEKTNTYVKHCFVFDAEVEGCNLKAYDGHLVSLGGDNSLFVVHIDDYQLKSDNKSGNYIVLLSPAFLTRDDVRNNTVFAVTQLMPFRFLTDKNGKEDDNNQSYHVLNSKLKRSERYELYAPGSVFYFKDVVQKQKFINALEGKKDFRQIGYNEYK